jgi:NADH:ubiquinone oxidoreductase subunit
MIKNYLKIKFLSTRIGDDQFGNRYYEIKKKNKNGKNERFVVYKIWEEPSILPTEWYMWLHHMTARSPFQHSTTLDEHRSKTFLKDHLPNATGTIYAEHYIQKYKNELKQSSQYTPWIPK